jgi:ATP-dependent Lon protease
MLHYIITIILAILTIKYTFYTVIVAAAIFIYPYIASFNSPASFIDYIAKYLSHWLNNTSATATAPATAKVHHIDTTNAAAANAAANAAAAANKEATQMNVMFAQFPEVELFQSWLFAQSEYIPQLLSCEWQRIVDIITNIVTAKTQQQQLLTDLISAQFELVHALEFNQLETLIDPVISFNKSIMQSIITWIQQTQKNNIISCNSMMAPPDLDILPANLINTISK